MPSSSAPAAHLVTDGAAGQPIRLVVVVSHPIQYFSPWFRELAQHPALKLTVLYLRHLAPEQQGAGFGTTFSWDVPLLQGYHSVNVDCTASTMAVGRDALRLCAALRDAHAQVVLVTGWQEPLLALAAPLARLLGCRVVMRGESNDLRARSRWPRLLHRALLSFCHAALAIGKSNRAFYLASGVPARRIFPGAYFVEHRRFLDLAAQYAAQAPTIRGLDGVADDAIVFAFSGKHVPFKRPSMLVEAAGKLVAEGLPVHLRFAGSGELTLALQARCSELQVPATFTGFLNQTEMWRAYVGSDVFVLPSTNRETWGLVVNEAMVFALPVIVSDQVGCGPDLVIPGKTGWTFSGEVDGLAEAMREAIRHRERLPAMGAVARDHVVRNYSSTVATDGLLVALASLALPRR